MYFVAHPGNCAHLGYCASSCTSRDQVLDDLRYCYVHTVFNNNYSFFFVTRAFNSTVMG